MDEHYKSNIEYDKWSTLKLGNKMDAYIIKGSKSSYVPIFGGGHLYLSGCLGILRNTYDLVVQTQEE